MPENAYFLLSILAVCVHCGGFVGQAEQVCWGFRAFLGVFGRFWNFRQALKTLSDGENDQIQAKWLRMPENAFFAFFGVSRAELSGQVSVKVVPNTKAPRFRHVYVCEGAFLACYACFQLQLEAGKALFRSLRRAKMSENVILGVSQAEVSGHMSVKVVPNTKGHMCRYVYVCEKAFLARYACFQLQLEAGKALFRSFRRAKMSENVILGFFRTELSGHMSVKVVPNTKAHRFGHV